MTVLVGILVVGLLGGSKGCSLGQPDTSDSTAAPTTAPAKALSQTPKGSSHTFTYFVDTSKWLEGFGLPRDARPTNESLGLHELLNDPRGWAQPPNAMTFTASANRDQVSIQVIFLNKKNWSNNKCTATEPSRQFVGCSDPSLGLCRIWLLTQNIHISDSGRGVSYDDLDPGLVYHEIGHCFGCPHTQGGVMTQGDRYQRDDYPSAKMVDKVKQRKNDIFRRVTSSSCDDHRVDLKK